MVGASSHDASDWEVSVPVLERNGAEIHYDVYGEGYPLFLFAPGGMNSIARLWRERPGSPGERMPWIDPTAELVLEWTSPVHHDETLARIQAFLRPHTPADA
jgi:hypothetical protein